MKMVDEVRRRVTNLLTAPLDELGRWTRFVRYQIQLWKFCALRLRRDNAMAMSSALSFRTIFALVPALILALLLVKSFGLLPNTRVGIEKLLDAAGVSQIAIIEEERVPSEEPEQPGTEEAPEEGPQVVNLAETIEKLVQSVERKLTFGKIGPVGVVVVIWAALALLTTMERSLNRVFDARRVRPLGRRVLLYWSVITLCPLLLITAIYLGRKATGVLQGIPVISWLLAVLGWLAPVIVGITVLALVYRLMPNTHVSYGAALGGAAIAVPLWMIAKWAFSLYVVKLVGRGHLYGALGLVPLFLFWLNVSWLIFLFGAEIAHVAANLKQMQAQEQAEKFVPTTSTIVAAAAAVAKSFLDGAGSLSTAQVAEKLRLTPETTEALLEKLHGLGIADRSEADGLHSWALARPAESISMGRILEIEPDDETARGEPSYDPDVARAVAAFKERTRGPLGEFTLADVVRAGEKA